MRQQTNRIIINLTAPITVPTMLQLMSAVYYLQLENRNQLLLLLSSDYEEGDPDAAMMAFNFINGIKGLHIHTHNLGGIGHLAIPLYALGHTRTTAPTASFHFRDIRGGLSGISRVYDIEEQMKLVLVTRLELAKTVAYKVGKTEKEIIAIMQDERTLHAEEAIGLQLAQRYEEKLLQGGDEIINI